MVYQYTRKKFAKIPKNTQNSSKYTQNYTQVYFIPEIQESDIPNTRISAAIYRILDLKSPCIPYTQKPWPTLITAAGSFLVSGFQRMWPPNVRNVHNLSLLPGRRRDQRRDTRLFAIIPVFLVRATGKFLGQTEI